MLIAPRNLSTLMTVGAVQYNCPKCNNPLFFTFKVSDAEDTLKRSVNCPGCHTRYEVDLGIKVHEPPKDPGSKQER